MKNILVNNVSYKVNKDVKDARDIALLQDKITDYYDSFDYIVGDWAYGKLRLKGFNNKGNKNYNQSNAIENVESYIENNCAYGCRYFILEKNKDWKRVYNLL